MDWNESQDDQLRMLWAEGHFTVEIGRRIGVTKNAVIGRAHKLKLPSRPSPIRVAKPGNPLPPLPPKFTDEQINRLIEIWPTAKSIEIVCRAVGLGKWLVVRKAAELGLPARNTFGWSLAKKEKPPKQPKPKKQKQVKAAKPAPAPKKIVTAPAPKPTPTAAPQQLAPLPSPPKYPRRSGDCCWPIGHPGEKGFRFCEAETIGGKVYCAQHFQISYLPMTDRRISIPRER